MCLINILSKSFFKLNCFLHFSLLWYDQLMYAIMYKMDGATTIYKVNTQSFETNSTNCRFPHDEMEQNTVVVLSYFGNL